MNTRCWAWAVCALVVMGVAGMAAGQVRSVSDATVFTMNEYIQTQQEVDRANSVKSDFLMRAWFKWGKARDYQADKWVILLCRKNGALFGGGVTMSALYKEENGTSMADFRRMASRDPWNHIFYPYEQNQMAHGAVASQEWLDYVLKWC